MVASAPLQNNFNGGEISPLLYGRPDVKKYETGLAICQNFVPLIQGPIEHRPGTYFIDNNADVTSKSRLVPFVFSVDEAYVLEFTNLKVDVIKDRARVRGNAFVPAFVPAFGTKISTVTPYLEADLFDIKFTQSADVLYIAHKDYAPRTLTRISDTAWILEEIAFLDGPYLSVNTETTDLGLSGTSGSVTVTASALVGINNDTGFQATDIGRLIRWQDAATNWTWMEITGWTSTSVVTATIYGAAASATTATVNWRLGVWSATDGYPVAVSFHQDRLVWGGGVQYSQRMDMSRTGDYFNMAPTDPDATVVDDHAVALTLSAAGVNDIQWFEDDEKGLLIGTSGGEWVVRPNDQGSVVTPSNVQGKRSSTFGSSSVNPKRVGRSVLFVQKSGLKVRDLAYVFEDDGFRAPDITLVAEHITRTGIVQMTYQQEPQSILWMVRTDGRMIGLTIVRDQEIVGWHQHIVGGTSDAAGTMALVESIASVPNPSGDGDDLVIAVQRWIGGAAARHIEYLRPFWKDTNDQQDAIFMDSALTYSGAATDEFTGLDHLEGETLRVLAEGAVHPDVVVSGGKIKLNKEYTKVQAGLGRDAEFITLRNNSGSKDGTAQGKLKRIHRVIIRVFDTLGGKIGSSFDKLETLVYRKSNDAMDTAVPLFTGDIETAWDGGYETEAQIYFRQDQPLPATIQMIAPQLKTEDRR